MAKKEKTQIKLPKAWETVKHRNETAQGKANYEDLWKALGVVAIIGVILFVLLGGVNQRKVWEFAIDWSNNVGITISNWLSGGDVEVTEDGVYWDPTGGTHYSGPNDKFIDDSGYYWDEYTDEMWAEYEENTGETRPEWVEELREIQASQLAEEEANTTAEETLNGEE